MGERFQIFQAIVDMARGFRQFQHADNALVKDKNDLALKHLESGLELFEKVVIHMAKAVEDVYQNAAGEINKGNNELEKSLDEFVKGNDDSAESHYNKVLDCYDKALDLLG